MKKIVTFGEVMLRLKPEGANRFFQTHLLEATFGGGEANVAVSLARFGADVSFVTALPKNDISRACISELRKHGVKTDDIIYKNGRMGIYFLEAGANQRGSNVIYDRAGSSIAISEKDDFDWMSIFKDKGWFQEQDLARLLVENYYSEKLILQEALNDLVRRNFLYYNPTTAQYKLQGRSMEIGLKMYVKEFEGYGG